MDPEASNSPEQETQGVPSHAHNPASLEDPTATQRQPQLSSTLCKAIAKVVGDAQHDNLSKLDKLHNTTKSLSAKDFRTRPNDLQRTANFVSNTSLRQASPFTKRPIFL